MFKKKEGGRMNKQEIIKGLNSWDSNVVIVFDSKEGVYREIKSVSRGLGKGILLEI